MIIVSFLLDGICSSYIPYTYFTLSSIFIYMLFLNKKVVYKLSLLFGILFDITYVDTICFNGIIFIFLCYLFYILKNKNLKRSLLIFLILFIFYLFSSNIIFIFFKYSNFNFDIFYYIKCLFVNIIYFLFLFIIKHKKILSSYK